VAEFSGISVITYAVMNNHFHILVEVPGVKEVDDAELVRRFQVLYPRPTAWQPMSAEILKKHLEENFLEGQRLRRDLLRRMGDISWMMKTLKHRFSVWFNQSRERFGTLWAGRFKSVLVEGDRFALRAVAAYIDLNPVRAGIVEDPKNYRFCGYAEAVAGKKAAREGLRILRGNLASYRQTLFGMGAEESEGKASFSRDEALRVLHQEKGRLPLRDVLRCRIRYFTEGIALGSPEFLRQSLPPPNSAKKGPPVPKIMVGADWHGLSVASRMRKDLFR